jgi:tRNA (cmo5U34)-methyltransferase
MSEHDEVMPEGKWQFDEEVAANFGDMLERSIPQYDVMRRSCFELGARFVIPPSLIVDLGCARGDALVPFIERFGAGCRYVGIEVSAPMVEHARAQLAQRDVDVEVIQYDLRAGYPKNAGGASLVLSVLTVQFVPIEYRLRILRSAYRSLVYGGALVLVEKVLGNSADLDAAFVAQYLEMKRANDYTDDQIERKRLSLEGVLVPVTADWNVDMLHRVGFAQVDCFWRWMNFGGWIAVKE